MRKHEITKEEYEQICKLEKGTKDKKISQKLQVLMLRYEGKSNTEIAERVRLSQARVAHLFCEYFKLGIEDFTRKKYGGNHRNLTYEEEEEILNKFAKEAEEGHIIVVKEIKKAFDEKLGRDTGRGYIYMLLKRHHWRKVMPRSVHPKKASDEEIAASKKLTKSWQKE